MAMKVDEETMERRRLERLERLEFFMADRRTPQSARRVLALSECHNLMTGFFYNSHWRAAWYCVRQAIANTCMNGRIRLQFFYWRNVLRLNDTQIEERIDAQ